MTTGVGGLLRGTHPALRRRLDRTLAALETHSVGRLRLVPRRPPIFVVGAPRSGTTALFLSLVHAYRVAVLPNVAKRHPRAPFLYAALTRLTASYRPTLANRFGIVDQPLGPSDGWEIFQRWFPAGAGPLRADADPGELLTLVRLFEALYGGPLCVRNNVNSLRIPDLSRLFPEALFVATRRDWREVAVSLCDAYAAHATPAGAWWSAGPPGYDPAELRPALKKAVFQVSGVEAHMARELAALPAHRRITIDYDALCDDPRAACAAVAERYAGTGGVLRARSGAAAPERPRRSTRWSRQVAERHQELEAYRQEFLAGAPRRAPGPPAAGRRNVAA